MPNDSRETSTNVAIPETSWVEGKLRSRIAKLETVLSGALPPEKFVETAMFLMQTAQGKLYDAIENAPGLFLACCYQSAMLGLSMDPMLGEFYVVPRRMKGKVVPTSIIGYRGLVKRVRRIPEVTNVRADVVREGDQFDVVKGTSPSIVHIPALSEEPRLVVAAWAVVDHISGPPSMEVCDIAEIERARSHSEGADSDYSPWTNHYNRMAMKTAVRRVCALITLDEQTRKAISEEELREAVRTVTQLDPDRSHFGLEQAIDVPGDSPGPDAPVSQ